MVQEDWIFLNPLLYDDLGAVNQKHPQLFCFESIGEGINDFIRRTGVKAKKLLTPEESQEIKKVQGALPPFDWVPPSTYDSNLVANWGARLRQAYSLAIIAAAANQGWNPGMDSDPDKK